jgi:hypothetical protein
MIEADAEDERHIGNQSASLGIIIPVLREKGLLAALANGCLKTFREGAPTNSSDTNGPVGFMGDLMADAKFPHDLAGLMIN